METCSAQLTYKQLKYCNHANTNLPLDNNWSGSDHKSAYYKTHQKDEAFNTQKYLLQINLVTLANHIKRGSNRTILEFKEVEDNTAARQRLHGTWLV